MWGSDHPEDNLLWHGFDIRLSCRYGDEEADFGRYVPYLKWLLDGYAGRESESKTTDILQIPARQCESSKYVPLGGSEIARAESQLEIGRAHV